MVAEEDSTGALAESMVESVVSMEASVARTALAVVGTVEAAVDTAVAGTDKHGVRGFAKLPALRDYEIATQP
jgi:hypothetical protein